jgi:hypothetical protein
VRPRFQLPRGAPGSTRARVPRPQPCKACQRGRWPTPVSLTRGHVHTFLPRSLAASPRYTVESCLPRPQDRPAPPRPHLRHEVPAPGVQHEQARVDGRPIGRLEVGLCCPEVAAGGVAGGDLRRGTTHRREGRGEPCRLGLKTSQVLSTDGGSCRHPCPQNHTTPPHPTCPPPKPPPVFGTSPAPAPPQQTSAQSSCCPAPGMPRPPCAATRGPGPAEVDGTRCRGRCGRLGGGGREGPPQEPA